MARLNFEDKIGTDPRFLALVLKLGDAEKAIGRLYFFWSKAQQSWANSSKSCQTLANDSKACQMPANAGLIHQNDFRPEWDVLIEVGFCEKRPDGYYAKGAEEHFGWLKERKAAASRGGIAKASKTKQKLAKAAKRCPLTPSLSLALSQSPADSTAAPPSGLTAGTHVWLAYEEAYESAYRHKPVRNTKANSLCKQLATRLGQESACDVVRFFLTHQKRWYVEKCHDLTCCVADAEALHTQMLADHRVTNASAQQADKSQGNMQAFQNVARKLEAERLERERTVDANK